MSTHIARRRYLTNFEPHRLPHLFTDVIVVGAGVAGLRAALEAARTHDVLVLCKDTLTESSTAYAQGGIATVTAADDTFASHEQDTLACAAGLAHADVVRQVVADGPRRIGELCDWGARFDRSGDSLATGREGGHSAARIVHADGDATGREIVRVLVQRAREIPRIRLFEHCFAIDLLTLDDEVVGVVTFHPKYGHQMFWARATILATGGCGRLYRETTNPPVATGDGLAMAYRAGATLRDMELVQFHPTTLYVAGAARALISEAVRGDGATLLNRAGERFMPRYHPAAELAPRDVVSRAIAAEMKREDSTHVFLDVRGLPPGRFAARFPNIHRLCRDFDLDPTKDPIPVRPTAHYMIGGVAADGVRSDLPGLLVCGEAACSGLHGANRLASNSLLEGLVLGRVAGQAAVERAATRDRVGRALDVSNLTPPSARTALDLDDVAHSLRSVMSRNVAIERHGERLRETLEIIEFWAGYVLDKVFDEPAAWETQNMLTVAHCIALGAMTRCESRGVHYRTDFPAPDDARWRRHLDLRRRDGQTHASPTRIPGSE